MAEGMPSSGPQLGVQTTGVRKKFATPPVKNACLSCRASRTRCDGGNPCASCHVKGRDCVYKPSKRGGARIRRKQKLEQDDLQIQELLPEPPDLPMEPISIQNYIDPGAGLKQLGDWYQDSDFIFDSLFMGAVPDYLGSGNTLGTLETQPDIAPEPIPTVRTYKDDGAILEAYYIFIHPYFPILPPPSGIPLDNFVPKLQNQPGEFDETGMIDFEPTSPIALAISAVLALIPCANDTKHNTQESRLFRRGYAQFLAQSAVEAIEAETEIPESSIVPQTVLSSETLPDDIINRPPFHPGVPQDLESIVALDILSVYEYAQRGNIKRMQNRASQALVSAMAVSIQSCAEEDAFSEARRRVWWMTYICVCQGFIVSNTQPTFAAFSPTFTAKYPIIQADPESFAVYIKAQQAILGATQFVIELNRTMQANGDMTRIFKRMVELEASLEPLITQAESWNLRSTTTMTVDPSEEVVGRALRCMARIKLNSARIKVHRYCAFFDLPVFTAKHCDLKSKSSLADELSQEPRRWPACSCSMFIPGGPPVSSGGTTSSPSGAGSSSSYSPASKSKVSQSPHSDTSSGTSPMATPPATTPYAFPFSSHLSAKICLRSAFNIAADFDNLPFPNPSAMAAPNAGFGGGSHHLCYLSPTSMIVAPRTMPSFACCAMQCAYSLLMVHQKTKSLTPNPYGTTPADREDSNRGGQPALVGNLIVRLQQGLMSILGTLDNYATAFEALGGMRDQIRSSIEPTMGFEL